MTQRLAWFGPRRVSSVVRSLSLALAAEVPVAATLDIYDEVRAPAFAPAHARQPYDVCIYELANASPFQFVLDHLFNVPGILIVDEPFDADAAIAASRMVLAPAGAVSSLQLDHPNMPIRALPLAAARTVDSVEPHDGDTRFALLGSECRDVARRAVERARAVGAHATLLASADAAPVPGAADDAQDAAADQARVRAADVVIAMRWPTTAAAMMDAAIGMSAGRPVLVFETEGTASWAALDPQSWQPRGFDDELPVVVTIDPRDEEHSLMLAVRRLSADAQLRRSLGAAARIWWGEHATPEVAATAWRALLEEGTTTVL